MRIVLTGGGSGGHLFPLSAVTRKISEIEGAEFFYIGPNTSSRPVFQREGIQVHYIFAAKIRRYLSPLSILDIFKWKLFTTITILINCIIIDINC